MLKRLWLLLAILVCPYIRANDVITPDSIARCIILSEMDRHPEAWQLDNSKQPKWNYTQGLELMGMLRWAEVLGMQDRLLQYAQSYTDTLILSDGSIARYRTSDYKLDGINSGKILFPLYNDTKQERYKAALDTLRRQLDTSPRVSEGGFWHKRIYSHQMWLDGLYMEAPFYAEYASRYETGDRQDSSYQDIVNQFVTCYRHTWCEECRLLHHGWDESGIQSWANPQTGRSAHAWGRAEGWYLMALVDAMEWLPEKYRGQLQPQLATLAESLLRLQRPDGCWQQVLDCADAPGNYEEMSATPMIAYALMKGYRMGWLDRKFLLAGMKATEAVCQFYLKKESNHVDLKQICAVAGLSKDRDGSLEYYLSEKVVDNDPKGIGPLLLALWEYPVSENRIEAGNSASLLHAIQCANTLNREPNSPRLRLHLPAGLYDLGEQTLTRVSGNNITIEGDGMDQTIIRNHPDITREGISTTATLLNTSTGLHLASLTLQNALDYYASGAAGRAVCLQDKGDSTVCDSVRMLSFQDTYYSNNPRAHHLMHRCEIHGTVDFICGDGDVVFDDCTIVTERRRADGGGSCTITAPKTAEGGEGYLFWNCRIQCNQSKFNLGRAWGNSPQCIWVNTTLEQPELLLPERFSSRGMRVCKAEFLECNTRDTKGKNLTPKSNILTITKGEEQDTRERVLPSKSAKNFRKRVREREKMLRGK